MVLDEATLVAVTSAPPPECGRCQRAERRFRRGIPRSSFDELLAAVDVEGRAGDRGVRHEVDGQCGDVGRADDAADRRGPELLAALADPSPCSKAGSGVSAKPAAIRLTRTGATSSARVLVSAEARP